MDILYIFIEIIIIIFITRIEPVSIKFLNRNNKKIIHYPLFI